MEKGKRKEESGKWKVASEILFAAFGAGFWLVFYWAVKTYHLGYLATVAIFAPVLIVGVLILALITHKMEGNR